LVGARSAPAALGGQSNGRFFVLTSPERTQFLHTAERVQQKSKTIDTGSLLARLASMLVEAPFNHITGDVIAAAIEVHRILGPGLLESTYMTCLQYELSARKLRFVAQEKLPLVYKGMVLDASYRLDLVVEDTVIVEVKSVAKHESVYDAQVLTYLNLSNHPVGLLINFNVPKLVDGVRRIINRSWRPT
jgi:GxxExxY protein